MLGCTPIKAGAAIEIYSSHFEISDAMILNVKSDHYNNTIIADGGAALRAFGSTISFHGVNIFINNTAIDGNGGALPFFW